MSLVTDLCGEYPDSFIKLDIANNPNYVFENDPSYSMKQLFDSEGNKVFVNSFVECEHYVAGGWGFSPDIMNEIFFQDILFYGILLLLFISFFKSKLKFIQKLWN